MRYFSLMAITAIALFAGSGSAPQNTLPILATADASTAVQQNGHEVKSRPLRTRALRKAAPYNIGDGLPLDRSTAIVDAANLLATKLYPQTDYEAPDALAPSLRLVPQAAATSKNPFYYGQVYDSMSPHPLVGAILVLAQPWNHRSYAAKTDSAGFFAMSGVVPPGQYELTLSKSASYATLHATVNVHAGHTKIALRLLALSIDEQNWIRQLAYYRQNVAYPRTQAVGIDQYAEILARKWAADCAAGRVAYGDEGYFAYGNAYYALPGAIGSPAGSMDLVFGLRQYSQADANWMAEKANCPGGNWHTCPFTETTGHYINLANGYAVWMGVGESAAVEGAGLTWPGYSAYDVMTIED